ncbi:LacI family transcriptional regulator [Caldibacillus lycopersici]|uniref:LacI family transcriptional regulator n=1 Tax=Perspicuibacillus lycopersici TaxID=1325689 RepID=A0AAE3LME3_9BACI|nr:LacI family DNA-binding transcriptional regulator [Perspicuibacillus lycopersici]MCU9612627.1 LacI family transcriptional regulator [Perspicuibacillus lycopersici]
MKKDVKKNITIYDIAKEAKVSPTTVSRVLTGNPLVKESTRQLVLEKMKELDFTPNEAARSLTTKQTNTIGFILPDITNPFFSQVYIEVEKKALDLGFTILLRNSMSNSEVESAHLKEFTEKRVECIVFMGGRINKVQPSEEEINEMREVVKRVPVIMVNGKMKDVNCYRIRTNEEEGIRLTVEHLVSLGHKKIGLIGGVKGITSLDLKTAAYRKSLKAFDLEVNPNWQVPSGFSIEKGREAMKQLLSQKDLPTAIIGINDLVIYGALKECREQNISIDNFSFVGFDDIFPSDIVHPSLTTVNHNYDILSSEIVKIIQNIKVGKASKKGKIINTKLIIRESTKEV